MTSWQKRVRIGLAIFVIVFAAFVYRSIRERVTAAPPASVQRIDPKANLETSTGDLQRQRQGEQDFRITFSRSLNYEDGSAKLFDVRIEVQKPDGRIFIVTTPEALAGKNQEEKQLTGPVKLVVSDGFELTTDRATHSEDSGIVRAPGPVAFKKGRMTGSGVNATYDQNNDVLTIAENAKVMIADEAGKTATDFSSGTAVLDRTKNVLTLDGKAHVLRNEQVIDADHVTTRLSDDEQIVTYIELRGNARVTGGTAIDSMSARDIDMDYTDDGHALERVVLNGGAGIAMHAAEGSGRQILGESLELHLAPDGSVVAATGRDKVRLDLPASGDSPAGSISAKTLDATGEAGHGLTLAQFRGDVEYREPGRRGGPGRLVRSQALSAALAGDTVTDAVFTDRVTFEEGQDLNARAAEVTYQPQKNALALSKADPGGGPHVAIDQISIDARTIDVALDDRRINAADVKTTLSPRTAAHTTPGQREAAPGGVTLPGLLRQNEPANINADGLEYMGKSGQAIYRGNAALLQGDTSIRGDVISLDQEKGNLTATGSARSTLELDTGRSVGRAHEIQYQDAERTVTYSAMPLAPTSDRGSVASAGRAGGRVGGRGAVLARDAQLNGPQGDLRAERIAIILEKQGNGVERVEAYTNVTLKLDARTVVGARLTYQSADGRYVMSGTGAAPVTITEATTTSAGATSCRETTGRALTFFKSTDTIIVDGNAEKRTETQIKPCAPPSLR
jgi:lipopolysaccharide export system protein LptA